MPSIGRPPSSDFPVIPAFPPVPSQGFAQLALPRYPLQRDFPHFPLVRYPSATQRSVPQGEETPQLALPRYPHPPCFSR